MLICSKFYRCYHITISTSSAMRRAFYSSGLNFTTRYSHGFANTATCLSPIFFKLHALRILNMETNYQAYRSLCFPRGATTICLSSPCSSFSPPCQNRKLRVTWFTSYILFKIFSTRWYIESKRILTELTLIMCSVHHPLCSVMLSRTLCISCFVPLFIFLIMSLGKRPLRSE